MTVVQDWLVKISDINLKKKISIIRNFFLNKFLENQIDFLPNFFIYFVRVTDSWSIYKNFQEIYKVSKLKDAM